jgi:hypothetical protein
MFHATRLAVAVIIFLPSAMAFKPATLHDVEVRFGHQLPNSTLDPSQINSLCARTFGRLGSRGQRVRVSCAGGTAVGRVLTIQIR